MGREYKCYKCKRVFETEQTEKEKDELLKEEFGEHWIREECETVCDDCYNKMFPTTEK